MKLYQQIDRETIKHFVSNFDIQHVSYIETFGPHVFSRRKHSNCLGFWYAVWVPQIE